MTSFAETRPRMRSRSASTTSPPSISAFIVKPSCGAAVVLGHHQVLRHVHQTAGQVAGVGRLQRRIRQALARAVRGDEVLQHVQPLAEVRRDRRLDDGAVRLRHQAAHAGELADLRGRAARAGVGHHVDGVERLLEHGAALLSFIGAQPSFLASQSMTGSLPEAIHHGLGHHVAGPTPDVHHLVVALALGDQAGGVLRLDLLHLLLGVGDDLALLRRHLHVVHRDRHAGAGGQREAGVHQPVGEDHRLAQPAAAEAGVDQPRDLLLLERLVDQRERQADGRISESSARPTVVS